MFKSIMSMFGRMYGVLPWYGKFFVISVLMAIVAMPFTGSDAERTKTTRQTPSPSVTPTSSPEVKCRERGISYFASLGSYPKLSDGRNAFDVAKERCARTDKAF